MIQLDYIDRANSTQTVPVVCMHCDSPTCAEVCPAHAIKRTADGVVQSARKPRCIACNNCVLACPFGIPKMNTRMELMMKCDQCYDRTSIGKLPMCASVCPSQALFFGTEDEVARLRPNSFASMLQIADNLVLETAVDLAGSCRDSMTQEAHHIQALKVAHGVMHKSRIVPLERLGFFEDHIGGVFALGQ